MPELIETIFQLTISFQGHKRASISLEIFIHIEQTQPSLDMHDWGELSYAIVSLVCTMRCYFTRCTRAASHLRSIVMYYTGVQSPPRAKRCVTRPSLKSI